MAEGSDVSDSEGLEKLLQSLLSRSSGNESGADSERFCADFCKVVEEYASHWNVALPQLRVLQLALHHFSQASTFLPTSCDHVQHTISSLALSVFELLLFFDQNDFNQEPLKQFTATFQECYSVLAKYENVFLLQVGRLLQEGWLWGSPALKAILSESSLPQNEVDCYISSELPVFLDLRVRYLLSCGRGDEAAALARCCVRHPAAGQLLFFLQVYLSWLLKTAQHDRLNKEVADVDGKDALHIICSLEREETDEFLLVLSTAFLSHQLQRGDLYHLCELVLVWTNLHRRLNTSKQALLKACRQLMLSATNVKSIFPFIRVILQEAGEDGVQFCVELCANALRSGLPCDVLTKTLIYKTIAGLLPSDLDVCRACALLVFFQERTVESYKMVYLLYMHPDQEYHVDDSPIGNNVRFETLQVLKKDLCFDPEFWNLIALRTNCLKLMSEKVVSAALEEIMEDKWISKYCTRGSPLRSVCQRGAAAKKRHHKEDRFCKKDSNSASKRFKMDTEKMRLNNNSLRRRGKQGSQALRESSSGPLRRSYWQLDRIHGSLTLRYDEHRRSTRFSERNLPKRKIKKPKWLLEDSGALENVPLKIKGNGLKQQKLLRSCVMRRSQTGPIKNNAKLKPPVNSHLKAKENNEYQNGFSLDSVNPGSPPQIILELSLPDNEVMDTFNDESCSRPRRFSQVLFYKPTVKYPEASPPSKSGHGKEVILRARDATMFVQLLHCYARRQRGKGVCSNIHGSVSTITRSSAQGSPSKDSELCERPVSGPKAGTPEKVREQGLYVSEKPLKAQSTKEAPGSSRIPQTETEKVSENIPGGRDPSEGPPAVTEGTMAAQSSAGTHRTEARPIASGGEAFEESAVEMKVTIASQASVLDQVSKSPTKEDVAQVSKISKVVKNKRKSTDEILPVSIDTNNSDDVLLLRSEDVAFNHVEQEVKSVSCQDSSKNSVLSSDILPSSGESKSPKGNMHQRNNKSPVKNINSAASCSSKVKAGASDKSVRTLEGEMIAEHFTDQDQEKNNEDLPGLSKSLRGKDAQKARLASSSGVQKQEPSIVDLQDTKETIKAPDTRSETSENSELMETAPETEESKLEHFCTFCSKFFMGARVVEHAMFHFRKDECTFCRTTFKDDLLAMMHLSDHIEKMKRLKAEENASSTTKVSVKAKMTNVPPGDSGMEKPKTSQSSADIDPPESRTLRSNIRQTTATSSQENQTSKRGREETTVHRVNGHITKKDKYKRVKRDSESKPESVRQQSSEESRRYRALSSRWQENKTLKSDSFTAKTNNELLKSSEDGKRKRESFKSHQADSKQIGDVGAKKTVEPQEKISCPVKSCSWFTDVLKNRVGLLYHALDKHYGDIKPLELAFRVGNGKCSICMRVMWSFEHFEHHVERHRLLPRHPCPHRGCKARFKSGMEMRRHARKHSPLQAMCCRPGCPQLFICLWALNLHEREHYASNSAELEANADAQRGDKSFKTPDGKKTPSSEDTAEPTVRSATLKFRKQARNYSLRRNIRAPVSASIAARQQRKLRLRNNSLDSDESENASFQPTSINLRLRQSLRKVQATNQASKMNKVVSSSLLKHRSKMKSRLKLKSIRMATRGLKRRTCPPRLSKMAAGQKMPSQDAVTLTRGTTKTKAEKGRDETPQDEVSLNDSKSNTSKIKRNHKPMKSQSTSQSGGSDPNRQRPTVAKKKLHKVRNHRVPSDSSKMQKTKIGEDKDLKKQKSTSKKPPESEPVTVKATQKAKNQDSAQIGSTTSILGVPVDMLPTTEKLPETKGVSRISAVGTEEDAVKPEKTGGALQKRVDQKVKGKDPDNNQSLEIIPRFVGEPKDQDKVKEAEGILKGLKRLIKSTLDEKGKRKEAPENATLSASPSSASSYPSKIPDQNKQSVDKHEKHKKSKISNKSETGRAAKRRKEINKDKPRNIAKTCKGRDRSAEESAKPEVESSPAGRANPPAGPPPPVVTSAGCSQTLDKKGWSEDAKSAPWKDTLAAYSKKPYLRPPPTVYLDEKYTAMPKRRKEVPLFQVKHEGFFPDSPCLNAALQRHRCAKCFLTFGSAEELQSHNQLQKCSNLFGFDSDEEGNS